MNSLYLSGQAPRLPMTSEEHLQSACDEGLISESHYLDAKRELPTGKSNKELARDLASFAIDGGTLIIGLEEDKTTGTFSLAPQPLKGTPERIEQVARDIPDPPLTIITRSIASTANPDEGYVIIHVPPSPTAPHMVENRYLGRGDKTKYYLSDPEVVRLHDRRITGELDGIRLLDAEFARDPIPQEARQQAHLFLLAEPVSARPELLLPLISAPGWQRRILGFAKQALAPEVQETLGGLQFSPDLDYASNGVRRPHGVALTDHGLRPDRTLASEDHEDVVELEIHEDGGLRIFMSRMSDTVRDEQVLFDSAAVIYVRRLLALVLAAAQEGGYLGNWIVAVGVTGLRGRRAFSRTMEMGSFASSDPRFTDEEYRRSTTTTYPELLNDPGRVAERLVGRLLRALGANERYPAARAAPVAQSE